jgi:phosphatidylserine/phosphatidylglycerophosphate/cardiolipin synthase-like enzyme
MKRMALPLLFLSILLLVPLPSRSVEIVLRNTPVSIYFSPRGGCTQGIIDQIRQAKKEILVMAYSFTSVTIAEALLEAHKHGVKVEAVLDKSQRSEKYTSATFLANAGIPTWIDDSHAIAHNKVIIIDRETVITGSFNFTRAAEERNAENVMVVHSRELAKIFHENWLKHREHSDVYRAVLNRQKKQKR